VNGPKSRWRRAVFALRPEECATLLLFLPIAFTLARMSAARTDLLDGPAAAYPGALARLVVLLSSTALGAWLVMARPQWGFLRDAMPFVFCANIYGSLHDMIRFFHAPDITSALYQWDLSLFGFEPTIWAERFAHPVLTDYFTLCYWLFYVLGPMLGLFLYLRRDHRAFRYTMVTLVLCLFLGYIGYVAWPASAPRLFMPGAYTVPLHGLPLLDLTRTATVVVPLTAYGAFPSLHCAVALLAVLLAWRYQRWFFWVQVPFATGLVVGTVYLRHHWVVDILAGFVLTFVAYWAGPRVEDWWTRHAAGGLASDLAHPAGTAKQIREPEPATRVAAKVMES